MKKIVTIVLLVFLTLSFGSIKSFAFFSNPWKNYNPKCKKFDFHCKRTSPKMTKEEAQKIIEAEKINEIKKVKENTKKIEITSSEKDKKKNYKKPKKIFGIFNNPYANANPKCKKFDFYCKRTAPKVYEIDENTKEANVKVAKVKFDNYDTELNAFTGMFDFSDDGQAAGLFGLQHQNDELFRESFLGKLSPITGGFLTEKSAIYLYTGVQAEYELGLLTITPSFAPGYYNYGDGKDLGYPLEFKSEVQVALDLSEKTQLGMSYNHISNASLGTKNPGANSYMFNFLKQF